MVDREKVIKGLTAIYDEAYDRWVHRQYIEDPLITLIRDNIPDALALLREQDTVDHALDVLKAHGWKDSGEAVKPKPTGIEPNYNCGKCGLPIQQGYPFCPWCGKAVKWDDD